MSQQRNFNIDKATSILNTFTVNVQDYQMLTPTLARVILTCTGDQPDREQVRAAIARRFNGLVSPVDDSFRVLSRASALQSIIGFVKAAREVKPYDQQVTASMKVMASNLLMDKADSTLWEVKSGPSGKYLCRQGNEDLSELAELARTRLSGVPSLAVVAHASTLPREFAAYVDPVTEEMNHGFVVDQDDDQGTVEILPIGEDATVSVTTASLVEVTHLDDTEQPSVKGKVIAATSDRQTMIDYYKFAYRYSPEYVQKIIDMIDQHSFA